MFPAIVRLWLYLTCIRFNPRMLYRPLVHVCQLMLLKPHFHFCGKAWDQVGDAAIGSALAPVLPNLS